MPARDVTITANFCKFPDAPVANDATGATTNTFTANWDAVPGALNYTLDVAMDDGFSGFVAGYEGLEVVGTTSHTVVGLVSNTTYYYRVSATDDCGTSEYSNMVSVYTAAYPFTTCGDNITFTYRGSPVTYGTVSKTYNEGTVDEFTLCWFDRNLGADDITSFDISDATGNNDDRLYGDLFQWGRGDDGHQDRTSTTTSTLSTTDDPGHGNFITVSSSPWDWLETQNDDLWQGVDGTNNPCPPGWRVPTGAELDAERESWGVDNQNSAGAYASTLKWPVGGYRNLDGALSSVGHVGDVWSSSVSDSFASYLFFFSGSAGLNSFHRAYGMSVRCVREPGAH